MNFVIIKKKIICVFNVFKNNIVKHENLKMENKVGK